MWTRIMLMMTVLYTFWVGCEGPLINVNVEVHQEELDQCAAIAAEMSLIPPPFCSADPTPEDGSIAPTCTVTVGDDAFGCELDAWHFGADRDGKGGEWCIFLRDCWSSDE